MVPPIAGGYSDRRHGLLPRVDIDARLGRIARGEDELSDAEEGREMSKS